MTNDTRKPVPPREIRVLLYETKESQPAATVEIDGKRFVSDPCAPDFKTLESLDNFCVANTLVAAEFDRFAFAVLHERIPTPDMATYAVLEEGSRVLNEIEVALHHLAKGVEAQRDKVQGWLTVREARATFDEIIASVEGIAARLREARGAN